MAKKMVDDERTVSELRQEQAHEARWTVEQEQEFKARFERLRVEYTRAEVLTQVSEMAEALRRAADEVSRYGDRLKGAMDKASAGEKEQDAVEVASWLVNSVMWVTPNLNVQNLMQNAAKFDAHVKQMKGN